MLVGKLAFILAALISSLIACGVRIVCLYRNREIGRGISSALSVCLVTVHKEGPSMVTLKVGIVREMC